MIPDREGWWETEDGRASRVRIRDGAAEYFQHGAWYPCLSPSTWMYLLSPYVPPEPELPRLEPCIDPSCGGTVCLDQSAAVYCQKCGMAGPLGDPDGARWNRISRAARGVKEPQTPGRWVVVELQELKTLKVFREERGAFLDLDGSMRCDFKPRVVGEIGTVTAADLDALRTDKGGAA